MTQDGTRRPTDAELAILQVLWERGRSTVRDVHEVLLESRKTGYTTTLKLMQIMAEKGLVVRDESRRTHVYEANRNQDSTQSQLVQSLLQRAFGGSAKKLIMHALSAQKTTPGELEEIRELLDSIEQDSSEGAAE